MDTNHSELEKRLHALELRVSRLEAAPNVRALPEEDHELLGPEGLDLNVSYASLLESKFGESGLAWMGNLVLFFGIAFLVQFIQSKGYQLGSTVFGYASTGIIYALAYYLQKTYPKMASIFNLNAYLLLFYVTLQMHFFSEHPIITSKILALALLSFVAAFKLINGIKKKSAFLTGISFVLLAIEAILSDATHIMLPFSVLIAATAAILLFRFGWIRLLYFSIFLTYFVHLIWFLNNPFMGHPVQAVAAHNFGILYLFLLGVLYSLIALAKESETVSNNNVVGAIIVNGTGFSLLLFMHILSFFQDGYIAVVLSVSAFCLFYSVWLQLRSNWKITASLYALFSYITLSIAIHAMYGFPNAYFLLAIQSLLVVSMAIWFRSKFIVRMNTLLFITLLIFYLSTTTQIDGVNISFSLAALFTARILNWKKDRLTIKTELLRNIYLFATYIMVLITLYHLVPSSYITVSWTLAAVIFFALSMVLKNVKYRYLAIGTMIAATVYLFIIDLAKIELVFRIVALLFLALISIVLSIYYTKKSKRKTEH